MGCVYLIEAINTGTFKIGVTKNDPVSRLKQLATGNESELVIIGIYRSPNYRKLEGWLHRKFADKRTNGEWFTLTESDIDNFIPTCHEANETIKLLLKENPFYN